MEQKAEDDIRWQAPEYEHYEKTPDWYWGLGLIAAALIALALYLDNLLFAFVIAIGAFAVALYAARKPLTVEYSFTDRGLKIENTLYPYQTLQRFWFEETADGERRTLLLESNKPLTPLISIPVGTDVGTRELRELLLKYLPEEEIAEPASQRIMEWFRF